MGDASSTPERFIEARDLTLTVNSAAGAVEILRGLDFAAGRGEAIGVVGRSGSGKSTLLSLLCGLERPTSGTVTIEGRDLSRLNEDQLARLRRARMGVVFQAFHLIPTMTALENVAAPLELAGRRDAFEAAAAMLERIGLGHRLRHYPEQLSGGEQQRTAIARAVAPSPQILLADEPTGNLDAASGEAAMETLFRLQKDIGATLVLVTHDAALAGRCDRVDHMEDGRIVTSEFHLEKAPTARPTGA